MAFLPLPHSYQRGCPAVSISFRIYINGNCSVQYHGSHNASVYISRKDDFFPSSRGGKDHALHCGGRPSHHQKGMGCMKASCRQIFCLPGSPKPDGRDCPVVSWNSHPAGCSFPPKPGQLWISPSSFMARSIKRNDRILLKRSRAS